MPRLISASKSSRGSNFFSSQPFSTLHVFYGVPTTQKWPLPGQKQSKHTICHVQFQLQKVRAAQTSFIPSPFPCYTSFTASQPRKNGRRLAKKIQNTQFATFNLGCKKFARRKLFSSQPFPTLHVFHGVPTTQNWPLLGQKKSKRTICHVYIGLQKFRAAQNFFIPSHFPRYTFLRRPNHAKVTVACPKTVITTMCHV